MENYNSKIEIQKVGSFFELDNDGYLVNPASLEKIQEEWKPVIEDIIDVYKEKYKEKLHSVYLRGSVAKGQAVIGISDIDTYAYVDLPPNEVKGSFQKEEKFLLEKYPFIGDGELYVKSIEVINEKNDIVFLNQSICVYGKEVNVPKLKPGKDTIIHVPNLHRRTNIVKKFFEKDINEKQIQSQCVWAMKGMLRSGCELVMERSNKYTRDLYPCYELFSKYYPEKEQNMRELLDLVLNPTSDKTKIKNIMDGFGVWLEDEYYEIYK